MANIQNDIEPLVAPIVEICERDNDAFFTCYFSREQDSYSGTHRGMDEGDALILIDKLIAEFNLRQDVIGML